MNQSQKVPHLESFPEMKAKLKAKLKAKFNSDFHPDFHPDFEPVLFFPNFWTGCGLDAKNHCFFCLIFCLMGA